MGEMTVREGDVQRAVPGPSAGVSQPRSGWDLVGFSKEREVTRRCYHWHPTIFVIPRHISRIYATLVASESVISRQYTPVVFLDIGVIYCSFVG